jgi:hypothetical protein
MASESDYNDLKAEFAESESEKVDSVYVGSIIVMGKLYFKSRITFTLISVYIRINSIIVIQLGAINIKSTGCYH